MQCYPHTGIGALSNNFSDSVVLFEFCSKVRFVEIILDEEVINLFFGHLISRGESIEESVEWVVDFKEFDRIGKIFDRT